MARTLLLSVVCVLILLGNRPVFGQVRVRGYTRSNGTYVQPHFRTFPDRNFYNNWSTYPNVNPYTGKCGTHLHPLHPQRKAGVFSASYRSLLAKGATSKLAKNLEAELRRSSQFKAANRITVAAFGGLVVLSGTVDSDHERKLAEAIVMLSPEVDDVMNNLTLVSEGDEATSAASNSDTFLNKGSPSKLEVELNATVARSTQLQSKEHIRVSVSGGVVTLTGVVSSDVERHLAGGIIALTPGVSQVMNRLTISRAPGR